MTIAFVDSNDYIMPDMTAKMLRAFQESKKDIIACHYSFIDEDNHIFVSKNTSIPEDGYYYKEKLINFMYTGELQDYIWNKIYDIKLFKE